MDRKNIYLETLQREIFARSAEKDDWNTACLEWAYVPGADGDQAPTNCICGHQVVHNFWIQNAETGHVINVGSTCISKFMGVNADLMKDVKQAVFERNKVPCRRCGRLTKAANGIHTKCERDEERDARNDAIRRQEHIALLQARAAKILVDQAKEERRLVVEANRRANLARQAEDERVAKILAEEARAAADAEDDRLAVEDGLKKLVEWEQDQALRAAGLDAERFAREDAIASRDSDVVSEIHRVYKLASTISDRRRENLDHSAIYARCAKWGEVWVRIDVEKLTMSELSFLRDSVCPLVIGGRLLSAKQKAWLRRIMEAKRAVY